MWKDPIVEEVRKIRLSIEEECHGNSKEILRRAMEIQKKYSDRLVSKPEHSEEKPLISEAKLSFLRERVHAHIN
jgi:hypothetical protein